MIITISFFFLVSHHLVKKMPETGKIKNQFTCFCLSSPKEGCIVFVPKWFWRIRFIEKRNGLID